MLKKIEFTKVVASGNDFIVIENNYPLSLPAGKAGAIRYPLLAKKICDRKFGVGADGLLLLEKSKAADVKMRIFNSDGSEAEMCGNGARCTALYISQKLPFGLVRPCSPQVAQGRQVKSQKSKVIKIETKAGIIEAKVSGNKIRIKLTEPKEYRPGVAIKIQERELRIHSINTGVPHAVIFVEGIEELDVSAIGRQIRYYEGFAPAGTNVDFVEVVNSNTIKVRTYERGVEDETLACGTGAAASAIVYRLQSQVTSQKLKVKSQKLKVKSQKEKINVITQGAETLKVYFRRDNSKISDVWLEGKAKIVYKGEYDV